MLCIIICVDYILLAFLDYLYPRSEIDLAPKFDLEKWHQVSSFSISAVVVLTVRRYARNTMLRLRRIERLGRGNEVHSSFALLRLRPFAGQLVVSSRQLRPSHRLNNLSQFAGSDR